VPSLRAEPDPMRRPGVGRARKTSVPGRAARSVAVFALNAGSTRFMAAARVVLRGRVDVLAHCATSTARRVREVEHRL
jgi:hypothetical protein